MSDQTGARRTSRPAGPAPLRSYPHVAACRDCRDYAASLTGLRSDLVTTAALAYHDDAHRCDPLLLASQHFG